MIDTHAHVYLDDFVEDRQEMIERARQQGVQKVILPNIDEQSIAPMQQLAAEDSTFFSMAMGIHPTSVQADYQAQLKLVAEALDSGTAYCAVGEIGIDLYWDKTLLKQQKEAFALQCDLALAHKLPVIIHARDSFKELFDVLEVYKNTGLRGVFHCFTGQLLDARKVLDYGFYLGIGGVVTYKNARLVKVLADVGVAPLVLETDAPFLSPVPNRGKRNEPANLMYIVRKIAEVLDITEEAVIHASTKNANQLFFPDVENE